MSHVESLSPQPTPLMPPEPIGMSRRAFLEKMTGVGGTIFLNQAVNAVDNRLGVIGQVNDAVTSSQNSSPLLHHVVNAVNDRLSAVSLVNDTAASTPNPTNFLNKTSSFVDKTLNSIHHAVDSIPKPSFMHKHWLCSHNEWRNKKTVVVSRDADPGPSCRNKTREWLTYFWDW